MYGIVLSILKPILNDQVMNSEDHEDLGDNHTHDKILHGRKRTPFRNCQLRMLTTVRMEKSIWG